MRHFVSACDAVSRLLGIVAMLLLAASAGVVSHMVFVRYILNGSTIWQTEFVIYALVASTFLGAPYVLLHKGHVGVDLLPNVLGPLGARILFLTGASIAIAFCALVTWSSFEFFYEALSKGWKTETVWAIPLWIPLLPLPLGMGMVCIQYLAEIWKVVDKDSAKQSGGTADGTA